MKLYSYVTNNGSLHFYSKKETQHLKHIATIQYMKVRSGDQHYVFAALSSNNAGFIKHYQI